MLYEVMSRLHGQVVVFMYDHTCVLVCGGLVLMWRVFLNHSSLYSHRQSLWVGSSESISTDMDKPSTGMTGGCASKSTQSSIYMGSLGWNLVLRLAACMLSAWTAQLSPELSLCKVLCSRVLQPHAFIWSRSEMKAYSIQPARWINGKFIVTKSEDLSFIPPKLQC